MNPADHLALLQEFYREKAGLYVRHQAVAERVAAYDSNNAYQYVLAREDAHLEWLRRAIGESGAAAGELPPPPTLASGAAAEAARVLAGEDARTAGELLTRWQPRVASMTHARDRKMLELVLGEVAEHQRFFAQAADARADLLGRRPGGAGTGGGVLPRRWAE
ncbi:MAG: hypothetical protein R6V57_11940 [Vicinamibacterales bacterium]